MLCHTGHARRESVITEHGPESSIDHRPRRLRLWSMMTPCVILLIGLSLTYGLACVAAIRHRGIPALTVEAGPLNVFATDWLRDRRWRRPVAPPNSTISIPSEFQHDVVQPLRETRRMVKWPDADRYWAYEYHVVRPRPLYSWQWGVVGRETPEYRLKLATEPRVVRKPPSWSCFSGIDPRMPEPASALEVMFGWPMRCTYYRKWASQYSQWFDDRYTRTGQTDAGGVWLDKGIAIGSRDRALPIGIIWPGLLVNTLFYSAVLGLLLWGRGTLRGYWCHRRNRCRNCGYRLIGSRSCRCSECGFDVSE